jgi:hypothetical protein
MLRISMWFYCTEGSVRSKIPLETWRGGDGERGGGERGEGKGGGGEAKTVELEQDDLQVFIHFTLTLHFSI